MMARGSTESARKTLGIFLLLAGLIIVPGLARADSDGYFCAAKGYLAVEFRSFSTPGLSAKHVLKVVRLGTGRDIHWAGEAPLPDFQTHFMRCDAARVEIAGWDNGEVAYTIDVTKPARLRVLHHPANSRSARHEQPEPSNLGLWSRSGVFLLQSDDSRHTFQVICTVSDRPVKQAVEHHHKTEIVQIDASGRISQRFLVFEGTAVELID